MATRGGFHEERDVWMCGGYRCLLHPLVGDEPSRGGGRQAAPRARRGRGDPARAEREGAARRGRVQPPHRALHRVRAGAQEPAPEAQVLRRSAPARRRLLVRRGSRRRRRAQSVPRALPRATRRRRRGHRFRAGPLPDHVWPGRFAQREHHLRLQDRLGPRRHLHRSRQPRAQGARARGSRCRTARRVSTSGRWATPSSGSRSAT